MFKDIGNLVWYTVEDGVGVMHAYEVYLNKKSVARSEFYTSYQAGLNASCVFELRVEDWEESLTIEPDTNKALYASRVEYNGAMYDIVRVYEKNGMVELTCS